ncbi:hypothetical protein OF83DRAFT_1178689 [Amylostereum chailletii]|nr:hypothetical protein OF83DRAFT_1178689 [Amylostereum chailletii]
MCYRAAALAAREAPRVHMHPENFQDDFLKKLWSRESIIVVIKSKYSYMADTLPSLEAASSMSVWNPTLCGQDYLALLFNKRPQMGCAHCGHHSKKEMVKRKVTYTMCYRAAALAAREAPRVHMHPENFQDDFLKKLWSRERIIVVVKSKYSYMADTLPSLEAASSMSVWNPTLCGQDYLALLFNKVIRQKEHDRMLKLWDAFIALHPKHYGSIYMRRPRPTKETVAQSPVVLKALDDILVAVKKFVVPKVLCLMEEYLPEQAANVKR